MGKHRENALLQAVAAVSAVHFAFFAAPSPAQAVEVDGIAARVGEDAILRSEVEDGVRQLGNAADVRYADVLNDLIDRRLILRAAQAAKMTLQDWVVENRVREIVARSFGGDRNRLVEALSRQKVSYPEWYARTKDDLIVGAMRWNVVEKNVTASPAAVRAEYEAHRGDYVKGRKVTVSAILLKPGEAKRRDEIAAALKEKTFEELGGKRYEDIDPAEVFKPEVVAEIDKMPTGTISHWIEIDGWSFLLRKEGEMPGKALALEDAYDEIEAKVKAREAKRLYAEWVKRLRDETYIKVF